MLLNLASVIDTPGAALSFRHSMDFSDADFGGQCPVSEPVEFSGSVFNEAGVVHLKADMSTRLHCVCDRCAAPFERDFNKEVSAILVDSTANEENEETDWTFLLQGDSADLDDILNTAFVLNMDSRMLCSEDCKGLCCTCGKNLNEGPCGCTKEIDPRLAVLRQLLQDKE